MLEIVDAGQWNHAAGPDFKDAYGLGVAWEGSLDRGDLIRRQSMLFYQWLKRRFIGFILLRVPLAYG